MYNTSYFKAKAPDDVIEFMRHHPFVILCGVNEQQQPVATHIPVLLEERDDKLFLLAHVMRKQDHTRAFEQHADVLAIFSGAHTYVSASWYPQPAVASTWNYQAVHAKGKLRFLDDDGLYEVLKKLTAHFEHHPDSPALVERMDDTYVKNMMKAIIAFEIEVTALDHVFKLSQNRDEKTYSGIVEHLQQQDADAQQIASTMEKQQSKIFPS